MTARRRGKTATFAIVMTGLPASGKTTLGRAVADALDLPCLDKDDFLEHLYECEGIGDVSHRRRLSRRSDSVFQNAAEALDAAVLVSHWRPRGGTGVTGTPTAWLCETYDSIVEVHCACSPEFAAQRFNDRQRHPGHLDAARDPDQTLQRMRSLAAGYPLGVGSLISLPSDVGIELPRLIEDVKRAIEVGFEQSEHARR